VFDGVEISREDEEVIEGIFFKKNWKFDSSVYGTTKNDSAAVQTYIDGIKSQVDVSKIKSGKFKVVLDIGNGAQAVTAVKLCEQLGCEVITINEQIEGNFPGRGSEPLPSNLHELSSAVVKSGADFGIAFDGDGDRSILCDNEGKLLTGDMSALLLSNYLLSKNPNSKVITAINSGKSPVNNFPSLSQSILRSPSPSKAIPMSALLFKTVEESSSRLYGVGSEPLPEKFPSICSLIIITSQPS
jgi:phosphomannomutase/phosphoglucomutase